MTRRLLRAALSLLAVMAMFATATIFTGGFFANAAPACKATWTVGIGGLGDNGSTSFPTVDHRIQYNSFSTRDGADQLKKAINDHRTACPDDHVKAIGHSGGAAALHVWATENGKTTPNANIILLSDPKRPAGPGGPGFAATDFPFNVMQPLAGANANYGGLPALQVCNSDDHICNSQSSWNGYLFGGRHGAYDFDVNHYKNDANGQIFK